MEYDVVIIGGSLSGAAAAVLLRRECPGLRILIVERAARFGRRVGEATVEVSGFFLGRTLGLASFLNETQLIKQGMRFWFANEETETLDAASEIGPRYHVWKFDAEQGVLSPNDPPFVSLPPGDGPRHFVFHPKGGWFYSVQEEGSTVVFFDYDAQRGALTSRQTISTLPRGFAGSNFCSEIVLSSDGRFLYAGNRLHDTIAIFAIGKDGVLRYLGEEWTRGDYPRSFAFAPGGGFLFCCNQRADHIAVFRADRENGKLQWTGHYAAVGNPSMIVFHESGTAG